VESMKIMQWKTTLPCGRNEQVQSDPCKISNLQCSLWRLLNVENCKAGKRSVLIYSGEDGHGLLSNNEGFVRVERSSFGKVRCWGPVSLLICPALTGTDPLLLTSELSVDCQSNFRVSSYFLCSVVWPRNPSRSML
jgi:hypothetical protein